MKNGLETPMYQSIHNENGKKSKELGGEETASRWWNIQVLDLEVRMPKDRRQNIIYIFYFTHMCMSSS